jgi:thiamine biosynthesis lipoprotein
MTSSGLYDQQFEEDGRTYWHILDPRTGYPAQTDLLGDTVITDDPTEGDALSTTLFVMGAQGARAWLEERRPEVRALFVGADDEPVFVNGFDELGYAPAGEGA